jgi:eukaryotic-like serine/threonine-protein kinase
VHDDDVPDGRVISTDPGPGDDVERGGAVAVLVSSGILQVEVPDVTGTSLEDAQEALRAEGLDGTITLDRTWHAEVDSGDVISLSPEPGETVDHDTALTIQVSEGREPISIPSVVNTEQESALAEIGRAGGEGQVNGEEHSDDVPAGYVIRQSVTGSAFRDDPVLLVISLGPELFEVPDVVGRQYDDAAAALTDLGFQVERQDTLGGFFGTVRLQDVEAGSMQPRGTVITLTVV